MMPEYTLYTDQSVESRQIELQLEQSGVDFMRKPYISGGGMVPVLVGPSGVFQGKANIQFYFLGRIWRRLSGGSSDKVS